MSEIQWFTLGVIFIGLVLEIRWATKNRDCFLMAIPWILLFAHYILFYVAWILEPSADFPVRFSIWSSILRGHTAMTIVGYSIYRKNQRSCA